MAFGRKQGQVYYFRSIVNPYSLARCTLPVSNIHDQNRQAHLTVTASYTCLHRERGKTLLYQ